jgi:hypothetical protein
VCSIALVVMVNTSLDRGRPRRFSPLRLEIYRRFVGWLHVERYRVVLMRDLPPAIHLTKADGRAHPDIGLLLVRPRS